jgi:glutamate synthase (ferredoxin)
VATQDKWLAHGLDPTSKGERAANYIRTLRRDLLKVAEACGVAHPALVGPDSIEILDTLASGRPLDEVYRYQPGWGYPSGPDQEEIIRLMHALEEPEAETEGPPETAEQGARGSEVAGDG